LKSNLKIGMITPAYVPAYAFGGPVTQVRRVAGALHDRGHNVTIYTTNATSPSSFASLPAREFIDEILVKRYPVLLRVEGYWFTPSMLSSLLKDDLDVIHANCARSFQMDLASLVARIKGIPLIVQSRGSIGSYRVENVVDRKVGFLYSVHNPILKCSFVQADKVIALTRAEAVQYETMGVPKEKVEVIPNGIDISDANDYVTTGRFRKKYGVRDGERLILFLGRIDQIKGVDVLIEAFSHLKKETSDIKLVIVGPKSNYSSYCEELITKFGVAKDVLFTGPLYGKDKFEAYLDSDVFVLPSRYEAFPNVVLEAFSCYKPVVASNVESIPDIVQHGKTGLIFETGNSQDLVERISYVLTHPNEAKEMGYRARKLVEEKFSTHKVINSLETLYEKVITEKMSASKK